MKSCLPLSRSCPGYCCWMGFCSLGPSVPWPAPASSDVNRVDHDSVRKLKWVKFCCGVCVCVCYFISLAPGEWRKVRWRHQLLACRTWRPSETALSTQCACYTTANWHTQNITHDTAHSWYTHTHTHTHTHKIRSQLVHTHTHTHTHTHPRYIHTVMILLAVTPTHGKD